MIKLLSTWNHISGSSFLNHIIDSVKLSPMAIFLTDINLGRPFFVTLLKPFLLPSWNFEGFQQSDVNPKFSSDTPSECIPLSHFKFPFPVAVLLPWWVVTVLLKLKLPKVEFRWVLRYHPISFFPSLMISQQHSTLSTLTLMTTFVNVVYQRPS